MTLEHTGERVVLEEYKSSIEDYVVYLMHTSAYMFAEPFSKNRRVLDYGCGSGYGSDRIAEIATTVDAVDVSDEAVAHANSRYSRPNLRFQTIEPSGPLPFQDASFDTVLSFQVLEHVADVAHYLSEVRRVLTPDGKLVLVTPDRKFRLLPGQRPWNRWHLREYTIGGLETALREFFPNVKMLQMGGRKDVVDVELRRYRKLMWMTLPFTLPFLPDAVRIPLLNVLHAIRGKNKSPRKQLQFDFDESSITIEADLSPSLNLVAVACPSEVERL